MAENTGKNKKSEEIESGEIEIAEKSPPKRTKKKALVPDDILEF